MGSELTIMSLLESVLSSPYPSLFLALIVAIIGDPLDKPVACQRAAISISH